jgi:hypothetical protein
MDVRRNQEGVGRSITTVADPASNTLNDPGMEAARGTYAANPERIWARLSPHAWAIAVAINPFCTENGKDSFRNEGTPDVGSTGKDWPPVANITVWFWM